MKRLINLCINWAHRIFFAGVFLIAVQINANAQTGCDCPDVTSCGSCTGGLTSLTLRYTGGAIIGLTITVRDGTPGPSGILFQGSALTLGNTPFTVNSSAGVGQLFVGNFVQVTGTLLFSETLATNCTDPVTPGTAYDYFEIVSSTDITSGPVCCALIDLDNADPVLFHPSSTTGCPISVDITLDPDECSRIVTWTEPTATDNCGDVTVTSTLPSGFDFPIGNTRVDYTATDEHGNTDNCHFFVKIKDQTLPAFTSFPSNQTLLTGEGNTTCSVQATWDPPIASDNCSVTVTQIAGSPSGTAFAVGGPYTITYEARDPSNNVITRSFTIEVFDDTAPAFTGFPLSQTLHTGLGNTTCTVTASWVAPGATDNCTANPIVTQTSGAASGTPFVVGNNHTITYRAEDANGIFVFKSFNIEVIDNTAPVFTGFPSDQEVFTGTGSTSCTANVSWIAPGATDNCTANPIVTQISGAASGTAFAVGNHTITYRAQDGQGISTFKSFTIKVVDNTAPQISGCPPSDIIVSAGSSCTAPASWSISATDNCDTNLTLVKSHDSGDEFPLGETTVTYTFTDDALNSTTCTFKVIILDNTPPTLNDSGEITFHANEFGTAIATWDAPAALDNCDPEPEVTADHVSGRPLPVGQTNVNFTAKDDAGNASSSVLHISVLDVTPPDFECPLDLVLSATESCEAVGTWVTPDVSDNSDANPDLVSDYQSGSVFPIGETIVTYSATDNSGNESSCTFKVTVIDDTPPKLTCPVDVTVAASETGSAIATWQDPIATDNCDAEPVLESDVSSGSIFEYGKTVVNYTVTDDAGNRSTCSFNVIVIDDKPPTITCHGDVTVYTEGSCGAVAEWESPSASDNCDPAPTIHGDRSSGDTFEIGETIVTYTATDETGNEATCTFKVIVVDKTPPSMACPTDITLEAGNNCTAVATWADPEITDCDATLTIESTHDSGDEFPIGETTVTYTATDGVGNVRTCSFKVLVIDTSIPSIDCLQDIIAIPTEECNAVVTWDIPEVLDNCGLDTVFSTHAPGETFPLGVTEVTYTAKDVYGNTATCTFNVIVRDKEPPAFSDCPVDIQAKALESGGVAVMWLAPTASSRCSEVTLESSHNPGDIFVLGITTVTYTATDKSGNVSICEFQVEVTYEDIDFGIARIVTPDGDGTNDTWILANIDKFSNNRVIVVDRWGGVIFEAAGYNNENVVWRGDGPSGAGVPTGTYFFTISVELGPSKVEKRGFIELIR